MSLIGDVKELQQLPSRETVAGWSRGSRLPRLSLILVVLLSLSLRLLLVARGGQLFWPDESRYWRPWVVLRLATERAPGQMLDYVLGSPNHWFFTVLGTPFAVVQAVYMKLRHVPVIDSSTVPRYLWVSAGAMTVFSLACIVFVFIISLRTGADEWEALAAACFMATANMLFYYSRHLFSYDGAMALALFALFTGLKREPSLTRSFSVGLVASLAFATYNGYWYLSLVVVAAHLVYASRTLRDFFVRAATSGVAFVLPTSVMTALTASRHLPLFVNGMTSFARTVFQGRFSEGWTLPFQYFWDAERLTAVVWVVLMVLGIIQLVRCESFGKAVATRHRALLFATCAVATYFLLATASALHVFVVYARTARQLLPFVCLGAAFGLRRIPRYAAPVLVVLVFIQAAWNFTVPLQQRFPADAERLAEPYAPAHQIGAGFVPTGTYLDGACKQVPSPRVEPQFVLMNTCPIWPSFWPTTPDDYIPFPTERPGQSQAEETIFALSHPLSWRPNQDDGFTPEQRQTLRAVDLRMRLIRVR